MEYRLKQKMMINEFHKEKEMERELRINEVLKQNKIKLKERKERKKYNLKRIQYRKDVDNEKKIQNEMKKMELELKKLDQQNRLNVLKQKVINQLNHEYINNRSRFSNETMTCTIKRIINETKNNDKMFQDLSENIKLFNDVNTFTNDILFNDDKFCFMNEIIKNGLQKSSYANEILKKPGIKFRKDCAESQIN